MLVKGLYEELLNLCLSNEIQGSPDLEFSTENLENDNSSNILAGYTAQRIMAALENMKDAHKPLSARLEFINNLLNEINKNTAENKSCDVLEYPLKILLSVRDKPVPNFANTNTSSRPRTSIAYSSLFTGSAADPKLYSELKSEITSSDGIDMLVSFIKWSGLRLIMKELKAFTDNGGRLRIITTTYMGATDAKAVEELNRLSNTEIKISYDTKNTRLHAKTYIFKRETGYLTAYVGSSNLSNAAISGGLEWNVKVAGKDMPGILNKIGATFNTYWNSSHFTNFNLEQIGNLREALTREKLHENGNIDYIFDIHPYDYQSQILEELDADRKLRGNYRNLVVSATGTGKTIISAFDYARFVKYNKGTKTRLLFIAHREEILKQSLACFRSVLKDSNFGELYTGNHTPSSMDYVFMSIQTFESRRPDTVLPEYYYDFIVIDEFHHAASKSYQNLLSYFNPKIMIGLTATPERMDGKDILKYFNNRITSEIRLPEAIDRGILSPFQYFGITDSADLGNITWVRGSYSPAELERLYAVGTEAYKRAGLIANAVKRYSSDINDIKGLGFCVSVTHAEFMARYFNSIGIDAIALSGRSSREDRDSAHQKLASAKVKVIFAVDLYNEGIDIPEINTVLFLRPTESMTVFIQQLGRGLRLAEGKECLTVLDFIGRANVKYNFTEKFLSLIKEPGVNIKNEISRGFGHLPRDCYIELERQAQEYILDNIKKSFQSKSGLISKISEFTGISKIPLTLQNFLEYYHLDPGAVYSKNSFSRLCVLAGTMEDFTEEIENTMAKAFKKICQINSYSWLKFLIEKIFISDTRWNALNMKEKRMVNMFYLTVWNKIPKTGDFSNTLDAVAALKKYPVMFRELMDILEYQLSRVNFVEEPLNLDSSIPLYLHNQYTRNQILASMDIMDPDSVREGVKYIPQKNTDVFFVTINKSEKYYSPTTMYNDYAISRSLFHWQTQSTVSDHSPTALRYFNSSGKDNKVLLFVREYKENDLGACPYTFYGIVNHKSHRGSSPVSIIWELENPIPPQYMEKVNNMLPG
jgi:superfamily II DNA or RNA helicase/HKD family nuclease